MTKKNPPTLTPKLTEELLDFIEEISNWRCECEQPPEGEYGVIECWGCRAKKLLRKTKGAKGG